MPWRFGWDGFQASMQLRQGFGEHVIRLLPPANRRETPQHFPGQPLQPVAGVLDQSVSGLIVSCPHKVKQVLDLRRVA